MPEQEPQPFQTMHRLVSEANFATLFSDETLNTLLKDVSFDTTNATDKDAILNSLKNFVKEVKAYTPDTTNDPIFLVKTLQKKYVYVSLFASLSYVYIQQMLNNVSITIKANHEQAILAAQQESNEALKKSYDEKAKEYSHLEKLLSERINGLSAFINDYANTVTTPGESTVSKGGGSKKKKRAQKGGFVRDGTGANLAGDPYPKAS